MYIQIVVLLHFCLPGILRLSSHSLPTCVISAARDCLVILSVTRPDGSPPILTRNGLPGRTLIHTCKCITARLFCKVYFSNTGAVNLCLRTFLKQLSQRSCTKYSETLYLLQKTTIETKQNVVLIHGWSHTVSTTDYISPRSCKLWLF